MHAVFEAFFQMNRASTEIISLAFQGPWGHFLVTVLGHLKEPKTRHTMEMTHSSRTITAIQGVFHRHGYAGCHPAPPVKEVEHNNLSSGLHQECKKKWAHFWVPSRHFKKLSGFPPLNTNNPIPVESNCKHMILTVCLNLTQIEKEANWNIMTAQEQQGIQANHWF